MPRETNGDEFREESMTPVDEAGDSSDDGNDVPWDESSDDDAEDGGSDDSDDADEAPVRSATRPRKKVTDRASLVDSLTKRYGVTIRQGTEFEAVECVRSTGIPQFDHVTGIGGLPGGVIVEFWGSESTGKTALALAILAFFQKVHGIQGFFADLEASTPGPWMETIGVQSNMLSICDRLPYDPEKKAYSGEAFLEMLHEIVQSGLYGLIIVDSVPMIESVHSLSRSLTKHEIVAANARMLKRGFGQILHSLRNTNTTIILINHLTFKIGQLLGDPETMPGGQALKHYKPLSIRFKRGKQKKKGKKLIGHDIHFKATKNKFAPPLSGGVAHLDYRSGIDIVSPLLVPAMERGIITGAARKLEFDGKEYAGQEAIHDALVDDLVLFRKLWGRLMISFQTDGMDLDESEDEYQE